MGTENLITYSPSNIYARDYYNAYNEFVKAQTNLLKYEQNTDDRQSRVYRELKNQFLFWDAKVPEKSQIAGREEAKIQAKQEEKRQQENNYASSPFYRNDRLDYMA